MAITAIGGQGGGVLVNWLVAIAEQRGYPAQATSVPGVAQRTGATVYYIELMPAETQDDGQAVFALNPIPGNLDIVVAAELVEAGRAIQRGFVTPDRTTLIASSHRVYSTTEKSALGDGTQDGQAILEVSRDAARNFFCFDMAEVSERTGSVISAVLLGAIAGSSCLPFVREDYENSIRSAGRSVRANLAGFAAGFEQVCSVTPNDMVTGRSRDNAAISLPTETATSQMTNPMVSELLQQLESAVPQPCRRIALEGLRHTVDYQDVNYGNLYLQRLGRIVEQDRDDYGLSVEVARHLALRMSFADTIRVAELKTRSARVERLRHEVAALPGQLVQVTEFMRPRVEEVCDTLPAWLGSSILRSRMLRAGLATFCRRGWKIKTTGLPGFLLLYLLASLKRWRRGSYRFRLENRQIEDWLDRIQACLPGNYELAAELVNCADLIKGYGDTHSRGLTQFNAIMEIIDEPSLTENAAATVRRLISAALADEEGKAFNEAIMEVGRTDK